MTKRNNSTRAELIEAGAALQREAHGGDMVENSLVDELFDMAMQHVGFAWRRRWQHACALAAQLAAEKAGLA